ncbi:MAG: hypothetical protein JWN40_3338 [Phycisphaerales bacterium]|nr:hypothetical protein [Phycisphaerales bacterium]
MRTHVDRKSTVPQMHENARRCTVLSIYRPRNNTRQSAPNPAKPRQSAPAIAPAQNEATSSSASPRLRVPFLPTARRRKTNPQSRYNPAMPLPSVDDGPTLLCPACGFDLRATQADRCGECGLEIDRAALQQSGIPWVYRRRIGHIRAYFKTAWQFTLDAKSIRYEASKPQESADGRAFARVTASVVAVALLAVFAAAVFADDGLAFLAIQPPNPFANPFGRAPAPMDAHWLDLAVPWSAGATLPPVLPICLILLAFYLSSVQRAVFRLPGRASAQGLSYYTAAPLLLLLPALACSIVAALLAEGKIFNEYGPFPALTMALAPIGALLYLAGVLGTLYRVGQWLTRTRHCGFLAAALGAAELIGLWLLGWVVLLGLVPWCVGFLWIVIDSLR